MRGVVLLFAIVLNGHMLVSTEWLAENVERVTVVHVGTPQSFAEAHIRGAHFLDVAKLAVPRVGLRDELPQIDHLQATIEELGVGARGRVVIYGDEPQFASRLFWTLDYVGQGRRIALLDGGLAKWRRERRAVASGAPDHEARPFTARITLETLTLLTQLRKSKNVPTVDARGSVEFAAAHIDGAVSIPWQSTLNADGTLRAPDELRKLLPAAPPARVIAYCDTGLFASWTYFVLRYLGYDATLYDGGFEEWVDVPPLP